MGVHLITGTNGTGKTTELRAMLAILACRKDIERDKDGNVTMRGYDFLTTPELFDWTKEAAEPPKAVQDVRRLLRMEPLGRTNLKDVFTDDKGEFEKATIDTFKTIDELVRWRPREGRRGVVIADEFHLIYNNREWETSGMDMTAWVSQHRHFRIDIMAGLQEATRTDKNLRVLEPRFYQSAKLHRRILKLCEYQFDLDATTGEMTNYKPLKTFWLFSPWPMKDEPLEFGRWEMLINVWKWGFTTGDTYASVDPAPDRKKNFAGPRRGTPAGAPPSSATKAQELPFP